MQEIARFLAVHPPFDGLTPGQLAQIAAATEIEYFRPGTTILRQNEEPIRHLYVIVKGIVELRQATDWGSELVETLAEGETFGQLALLGHIPHLWDAVAAQDASAIAACLKREVEFRALTPPGLRERTGAADAAALVASWFADSTELDLVDSRTEEVGDRLHVAYRFEGVEDGEPYVVEQHLYCVLDGSVSERADLLCSGFRPRDRK